MSDDNRVKLSRRSLLAGSAAIGSAMAFGRPGTAIASAGGETIPFYGVHQAGILTDQQSHTYYATFDVTATKRADIVALLKTWTDAAARLTSGQLVQTAAGGYDASAPIPDSGEVLGLGASRLTLTFGFGPEFFVKDGHDRFGLGARCPDALATLPRFAGDKLVPEKTGGEVSVQACADDPQVAFHAVRQLARLGAGAVQLRWVQSGFVSPPDDKGTARNLMGFKDGTQTVSDPNRFVWAGHEAPAWMRGGSYVVVRRIRVALEHWDQMKLGFQEQTVGRQKLSGAPIGMKRELDPLPLTASDSDGNPIIADTAHVRLANSTTNDGMEILRRGYSYNDGVDFTTERWPPWRQAMEYDAGLFFVCYQRDPRHGFIPIFNKMSKIDMLNQFTTHTGGAIFACPGGIREGEYLGQSLFEG